MSSSATLSARRGGFLGGELMGRSLLVGGLTSFATGGPGLLRRKFVSRSLLVRRLASLAGDLPLFFFFHGAETTVAFAGHAPVLSKQGA
jgi:hypothetical protein